MKNLEIPKETDKVQVLLIDDHKEFLALSKEILETKGDFEVETATSVDEALKKVKAKKIDVVVSDYEMPKKSGLELLEYLRSIGSNLPFILFTGKGREEIAIKALNLKADGYISKQGKIETVYGELSHHIHQLAKKIRLEKRVKEQTHRVAKISSQISGILYQYKINKDGSSCIPFATEGIRKVFGVSPEEVKFNSSIISKVIYPPDLKKIQKLIRISAKTLKPFTCEYRVKLPGQSIRWFFDKSIPEKQKDGSMIWSGYNVDITEQKKVEEKLKRRLKFEKVVAKISTSFVYSTNFDDTITAALNEIGKLGSASRAYIFLVDGGERSMSNTHEWCAKGVKPQKAFLQNQQFLTFPWWIKKLSKGETINVKDVSKMPPKAKAEKEVLEKQQIKSVLVLPLTIRGELCGFIGFDNVKKTGEWQTEDIMILETFSQIIGTAIYRKKTDEKIREDNKNIKLLNEKYHIISSLTRHDVCNKIMVATSNLYLLKKKIGSNPQLTGYIRNINAALESSCELFEFSRIYEKIGSEKCYKVNVSQCFKEAKRHLQKIETIKISDKSQGLEVLADSLLRQVFYNLIDNTVTHGKNATAIRLYYIETNKSINLCYEDNGIGIPYENKTKLFNVGFTTGRGKGLGLHMIKKILDTYDWQIEENGKPSRGVKFEIKIPKLFTNETEKIQEVT